MAVYEFRSLQNRGGFRVAGALTKVGRAPDNTVVLNDNTVSRYHLNLYVRDDGSLVIENAGSQNGFLHNGLPASGPTLGQHGDRIAFGSLEYMVLREGLPPPAPKPNGVTGTVPRPSATPLYEAAANVKYASASAGSGRLRLYGILGLALLGIAYLGQQGEEGGARDPASTEAELSAPLANDDFKRNRREPLSQSEIEAEGFFRAGMRDFHNRRYTRALQAFQQARTKNPAHPEATYYIEQTETQLKALVQSYLKDADRSFSLLQYTRAKLQAVQVLTLLADQVPAYSRQIASEAMARKPDLPSPTHEETLMKLECKLTRDADACQKAVRLIKEARNRLGEENELR